MVTTDWTGAQAAVIGSGLIDARCVPLILADTRPEDFTGAYLRFYEAFAKLAEAGEKIDPVTVLNVIGPDYRDLCVELMQSTPTAANVAAYITVCREQSRLSLLKVKGTELAGAATLEEARKALAEADGLSLDTGRRTGYSLAECASEWYDEMCREDKPEFIDLGFPALNSTLMVTPGNFIILAGYTGFGKTALGLQMAEAVSRRRHVGFFSYEMSRQELTERAISREAGVDYQRLQTRELSREELRLASDTVRRFQSSRLRIEEAAGFTVEDIRAKTLREGYGAIFVDYLQHVAASDRRTDTLRRVSEASMGLKSIAQRYGIPVFAMCQMSRPERTAEEFVPFPKLRDLRESGQIEQDANAVLFVHAPLPQSRPGWRALYVAKNRKGRTANFDCTFEGSFQRFRPPTEAEASEYRKAIKSQQERWKRQQSSRKPAPGWSPPEPPGEDLPFEQMRI